MEVVCDRVPIMSDDDSLSSGVRVFMSEKEASGMNSSMVSPSKGAVQRGTHG